MKKILSLFALLMAIVIGAKAGTETQPASVPASNGDVIGTSYTIPGTFNAGAGSTQKSPMESKGVKVRLNRSYTIGEEELSNVLVINVNEGYELNGLTIYGITNSDNKPMSITSIKVDGVEQISSEVAIPAKNASAAGTLCELSGMNASQQIVLTFGGSGATQGNFDFHFTYTQTQVITQEVTGVTLNGSAISDTDLATLKSTKALTINGSSLNGLGTLDVTLSSGATTVSRAISDGNAVYTFAINNGADEYTVTVTNIAKSYTAQGSMIYYSKDGTDVEGANTKTITANGITAEMVADKTFQYGSGSATIGGNVYVPLKLSTGSGVNVTFPAGKKATKVIVYGWSANGDGAINSINESETADKAIDTSADIFYATNASDSNYPSVYEYTLDNWESFYFNPGGSASQPFVVMDFVFAGDTPVEPVAVTGVEIDQAAASVEVGKTVTLVATVYPENADNQNVTWTSSDEAVATVADGVVSGIAEGSAIITVTTEDGGFTATCPVTVSAAAPVETPLATLPADLGDNYQTSGAVSTYSYSGHPFNGVEVITVPVNSSITITVPFTAEVSKIVVTGTSGDNDASTVTVKGANDEASDAVEFPNRKQTSVGSVTFVPTTQTTTYTIESTGKKSVVQVAIYGTYRDAQSQNVTVGETGFATIGLPFAAQIPEGVTAYAVTAVNGGKVTTSDAITEGEVLPANKGFIIMAAKADYTFTEAASATYEGESLLQAAGADGVTATATAPIFVLAKISDTKVGFRKSINGTLGAYKAYLSGTNVSGESLEIDFGGAATAINGIAEAEAEAAPAKVVKNGKLYIGNYNVAGQLVK